VSGRNDQWGKKEDEGRFALGHELLETFPLEGGKKEGRAARTEGRGGKTGWAPHSHRKGITIAQSLLRRKKKKESCEYPGGGGSREIVAGEHDSYFREFCIGLIMKLFGMEGRRKGSGVWEAPLCEGPCWGEKGVMECEKAGGMDQLTFVPKKGGGNAGRKKGK